MIIPTILKQIYRNSARYIILTCMLFMLGCNKNAAIAGKYIDKKIPDDYTELKADGTFVINQRDIKASGKYSYDKGRLVLTMSTGEVFEGRIEGNAIIGNNGSRAIRYE